MLKVHFRKQSVFFECVWNGFGIRFSVTVNKCVLRILRYLRILSFTVSFFKLKTQDKLQPDEGYSKYSWPIEVGWIICTYSYCRKDEEFCMFFPVECRLHLFLFYLFLFQLIPILKRSVVRMVIPTVCT